MVRAEKVCKDAGGRLTPIRRRIFELIWEGHAPVKAYDLLKRMQAEGWSSAPSLVYRALAFLSKHGLVHHLTSLNAYVGCHKGGEDHCAQFFVCSACARVDHVDDDGLADMVGKTAGRLGYAPDNQVVEIKGLCPDCRAS